MSRKICKGKPRAEFQPIFCLFVKLFNRIYRFIFYDILAWSADVNTLAVVVEHKDCQYLAVLGKRVAVLFGSAELFDELFVATFCFVNQNLKLRGNVGSALTCVFLVNKYVGKIFDTNGKPRTAKHLVDDIVEMFKVWESGKTSNKLNFMFESKEAGSITNLS